MMRLPAWLWPFGRKPVLSRSMILSDFRSTLDGIHGADWPEEAPVPCDEEPTERADGRVQLDDAAWAYAAEHYDEWESGSFVLADAYIAGVEAERDGKHLPCPNIDVTVDRWVVRVQSGPVGLYIGRSVIPLLAGAPLTTDRADAREFGSLDDADRFCRIGGLKAFAALAEGVSVDIVPA